MAAILYQPQCIVISIRSTFIDTEDTWEKQLSLIIYIFYKMLMKTLNMLMKTLNINEWFFFFFFGGGGA